MDKEELSQLIYIDDIINYFKENSNNYEENNDCRV